MRRSGVRSSSAPPLDRNTMQEAGLLAAADAGLLASPAGSRRRTMRPTRFASAAMYPMNMLGIEHPAQFFSYAARAMRHLLANRARDRLRLRAGGQWMKVTLDEDDLRLALDAADQALALDAALDALEQADARAAQVVELHYFAGLGLQQIGDTLGVARRTIDRDWRFARAFLKTHMD